MQSRRNEGHASAVNFYSQDRGERAAGGIDWIRYRQTIRYPLSPWLMQFCRGDPGRGAWLDEDNAPSHRLVVALSLCWVN